MAQNKQLSKQNRQSAQNVESDQSGNKNLPKRSAKNEASRTKAGNPVGAAGGSKGRRG